MAIAPPVFAPLALLLAGVGQALPQQTPQAPPTADEPALTTIALKTVEDRMTVPVQIAGAGPYRFVIDTGAERTVISRELAGTLGLPAGRPVNVTAMSGTSRVGTVIIPSIQVSDIPDIGVINAPALDAAHLGGQGLLGVDTLRNHKVVIDFDAATMAVRPSTKRKRSLPKLPGEIVVEAKSMSGQLIFTDASFDGMPIRVVIDTGSPVSVGNEPLRRLMARRSYAMQPLEMTSATGGIVQTKYARVDKLRIGNIEFLGMPIAFADLAPFRKFGLEKRPAMFLGMNSMKFFRRVAIDFPNREVRFQLPRRERMAYRCMASTDRACPA